MRRIAIVGSGQTKYERQKGDQTAGDIIYEAVKKALRGTGLGIEDIDFVADAGSDVLDGRSISNVTYIEAMGCHRKEEWRIEEDGSYALFFAYAKLLSGAFDTALVIGYGKGAEMSVHQFTNLMFDPFLQRPLGLDGISGAALQAQSYIDRYGISQEQIAGVVVKNRQNGLNNPHAQLQKEITMSEALNSEMVASPLRKLDLPPISEGACAVVLAAEETALKITSTPAWIKGAGHSTEKYYLGYKDLYQLPSCQEAARQAYAKAGIKEPLSEIDLAELSGAFPFQELMLYEALGFCQPGEGGKLIATGATKIQGQLPVNVSGGPQCANPMMATGLVAAAEAALQISGQAGDRQVPGVKTALVHGTSGLCMQSNCVFILGRE